MCKAHYYSCLTKELGINSTQSNPTYTRTSLSKEETLDNHLSVLTSFGIKCLKEDIDLPILYWIPKLHKIRTNNDILQGQLSVLPNPANSTNERTNSCKRCPSEILCYCLLQERCQSDVDLKKPKELLDNLKCMSFSKVDSIKTFVGSTVGFLLLQCSSGVVRHPRDLQVSVATRFCRVLIFASS